MAKSFNELVAFLQTPESVAGPDDIIRHAPDLSYDDAYRLQFAAKELQKKVHGEVIGYQASFTSASAKKFAPPGMPTPYYGTLLRRNWRTEDEPIKLVGDWVIESEIGVLLKRDLTGPGVTAAQARGAIEGFFPAVEVPYASPQVLKWSGQQLIAVHNMGSFIVFGSQMTLPTIDLRHEGLTLRIDGELKGSATAAEAMGDPLNVVADMANTLARFERGLKAGMVLMTGSCISPLFIPAGAMHARVDYTRMGSVSVRFTK